MIRRSSTTAFGGMWAFPGGVIESEDIPAGTMPDPVPAARVAAVRETREEVGLHVDEDTLVFFSHWLPPANSPKRFSTWFFAAPVPDGAIEIDRSEVHDHRWFSPGDAMSKRDGGEIQLVAPTFITLVALAAHDNVASALAAIEPFHFATRRGTTASGIDVCMYAGDVGYEAGRVDDVGPHHRLLMDDGAGWYWVDDR